MPMKNSLTSTNSTDKPEKPRRWITIKIAALLTLSIAIGISTWVVYQIHCFRLEIKSKTMLEADVIPSGTGLASLAIVNGPTAEEAPYLTLSELKHGRIYVPIVSVSIGRTLMILKLDQVSWGQLQSFHYLQNLELSGCSPDPKLNADFSEFKHLEYLLIADTEFSTKDIGTLAQLPQLQELIFQRIKGINEWLECIGKLRHIKSLEIEGHVSNEGIRLIAGWESLESLSLESDRITSKSISYLARLKNLKTLSLSGAGINDECLRQVAALKGLTGLCLMTPNGISDEAVKFLAELKALELLSLNSNRITSNSASTFIGLKNLKQLILPNTRIDDEGLRQLSALKELGLLDLSGSEVANIGVELDFPRLNFLDLSNTNITDASLKYLLHLPQLRCLVIFNTRVTNESIDTLSAIPSLMEVYARGSQIDENNIKWLNLMSTLKKRRDDEAEQALISMPKEKREVKKGDKSNY